MAVLPVRRRIFGILALLALFIAALSPGPVLAKSKAKNKSGNPRYASIVMDADTGVILEQSNADKVLHPASLAKMMTLLLTFEAVEQGRVRLRDRIVVSQNAARAVPSKLDLKPGSSLRVEDAIYALVTKSANDVAVALAEHIGGGSEAHFAVMMNRKARAIGMSRTNFTNASGLHNPRQVTSARDMAKLARYILTDYPQYYHYFSTRNFTYQGLTHRNHNRLMESYKGMDGFKTGYIAPSGFNLVASAKRGDRRLIGVVFGGMSANSRNAHMKTLLDRNFGNAPPALVAQAPIPPRKPQNEALLLASASGPARGKAAWNGAEARMMNNAAFSEVIGEGDYDPAASEERLETGMMAIAALKGQSDVSGMASGIAPAAGPGRWSVQVGAFGSRAKTDRALAHALQNLPAALANGTSPVIAPMKTREGWLFRGRLTGLTQAQAVQACAILKDCLPVAPQSY